MSPVRTAIVVLNYGGTARTERALPSLREAAARARRPTTVHVLDNDCDPSREGWARDRFPGVVWRAAAANRVLCSFNDYLRALSEEAAILLNNDIEADPGFVDPLVDALETREDAFLVAPRIVSADGAALQAGPTRAGLRWGLFGTWARDTDAARPGTTFSSGMGAVRRDRFLDLGGYDDLFLPGICEDADLGWRAWRRGWRSYYAPDSVLRHAGQASFHGAFGARRTEVIAWRNGFLLLWKNLRDPRLWAEHLALAPPRLAADLLRLRTAPLEGLLRALPRLPSALSRRAADGDVGDRTILSAAGVPL